MALAPATTLTPTSRRWRRITTKHKGEDKRAGPRLAHDTGALARGRASAGGGSPRSAGWLQSGHDLCLSASLFLIIRTRASPIGPRANTVSARTHPACSLPSVSPYAQDGGATYAAC